MQVLSRARAGFAGCARAGYAGCASASARRVVEEEVQNLTVERMIPPIRFRRGGLRSQIILGEKIL